jgi:hypothetical protein
VSNVSGIEVVPLDWCVNAMNRAFERAREKGWNDPIGAYASVAETLFWIDVVAEQLKCKYQSHYDVALAEQTEDVARMLTGLLFARNRITHEVDQVGYLMATAKGLEGFAANWTWQSLPPRPGDRQADWYRDYEAVIAGRDVVTTLLATTVFLGQARHRIWQNYGRTELVADSADELGDGEP